MINEASFTHERHNCPQDYRRRTTTVALAALALFCALTLPSTANAAPGEVVMLDTTLTGGINSTLAQKFVAAGKTPVVKTATGWSAMTAADFDSYDAIVLGDPTCTTGTGSVAAAEANATTWGAVVDGNVFITGTDETVHETANGAHGAELMEKAVAFTVANAGKTGAYISLSCYYHGTAPGTPIPVLDGLGTFTATGVGCYDDAHIVATHPALTGLTDAMLSNWGCSVHEGFDSWDPSFEVLTIAEGAPGGNFVAADGTVGVPYMLARGVELISDIKLSPGALTNTVGTSHTVNAKVTSASPTPGTSVVGTTVTFSVISGPHTGTTGTGVTDSNGDAAFSYTGTMIGTDTIEATFIDAANRTQRSNKVTSTWVLYETCDNGDPVPAGGCNASPSCTQATADPSLIWSPNHEMVTVGVVGVTDADNDTMTTTITSIRQDEPVNGVADGDTSPDGSGVGTSTAAVRAERAGSPRTPGNGRVYHIGFTTSDGNGGTCSGTVTAAVPHDKSQLNAPVDDGPLYDSTTS